MKLKILAMLALVFLAGCEFSLRRAFSNPAAPTTEQANILSGGFVSAMKAGKTTREQEQAHLLSMDAEVLAVDGATRGSAAAAAAYPRPWLSTPAVQSVQPATQAGTGGAK